MVYKTGAMLIFSGSGSRSGSSFKNE